MSYIEDTRSGQRSITIIDYEPDVEIKGDYAYINGPNGLTYVCVVDDILRKSEGEVGRVSVLKSVVLLTSQIEQMSGDALVEY